MDAAASQPEHLIRKQEHDSALTSLSASQHAALTTENSASMLLELDSGSQKLKAHARLKPDSFNSGHGRLLQTEQGLIFEIGEGPNQAAKGSEFAQAKQDIQGKAAAAHTHVIGDVSELQTALSGKAAASHSHSIADVAELTSTLTGKAPTSHSHEISAVTGLSDALAGKAAASHSHGIADVAELQTALNNKANAGDVPSSNATSSAHGLMSASDKQKLDNLSESQQWRASVANFTDLPLNVDPVGTCRLVRSTARIYRCATNVGARADQWKILPLQGQKYAETFANGIDDSFNISHGLGTEDVIVQVRKSPAFSPEDVVACDIQIVDQDNVLLSFDSVPESGSMRVTVV
jgi:hypothetical protein